MARSTPGSTVRWLYVVASRIVANMVSVKKTFVNASMAIQATTVNIR